MKKLLLFASLLTLSVGIVIPSRAPVGPIINETDIALGEIYYGDNDVERDENAARANFLAVMANPVSTDDADIALGERYLYGDNDVKRDPFAAFQIFKRVMANPASSRADVGFAMRYMGEMLLIGNGVEKDLQKAYFFFMRVEEMPRARPVDKMVVKKHLGEMLFTGNGVERDENAARAKFREADAIEATLN